MEAVPCATFEEVIDQVRQGDCDLGMLAVENSTYGRVADVHALLPQSGLHIVDEAFVRVHINLLAVKGATLADVILPAAAYTEENGLFVNTEGRPQLAMRAGFAPGEAKENWAILRALSSELGKTLPWDSVSQLRAALVVKHPHLGAVDQVADNGWTPVALRDMGTATFRTVYKAYYMTNPIARASATMGELAALEAGRVAPQMAAE